jgi:taurine dioxygenase
VVSEGSTAGPAVVPVTRDVGAEITGVDLSRPLTDEERDLVHQALLRHKVVFFRDQAMAPADQLRFTEYFGPVMLPVIDTRSTETAGVTVLDQIAPKNHYTDRWHTDHTFVAEPPMATVLHAVQLPSVGGDTCFSNMALAYELLSPAMQRFLDGLTAVHSTSVVRTVVQDGTPVFRRDGDAADDGVVHPVVRIHPETGEKVLFVCGNFTSRIVELREDESRDLLATLFEHVKSPELQCRFKWTPGAVAFWDNRAVQHCAIADYDERRVMHRTMVAGDRPFGTGSEALAGATA